MTTYPYPVGIVGAGPCGLLTALLLARFGIRCAVFERQGGLSTHPKAMGISRRTAEIFRQTGVLAPMLAASLPRERFDLSVWESSLVGEEYGRIPWEPGDEMASPCQVVHCPQTVTEQALLSALEKEENASIFFDHEVTSLEEIPGGIHLHVHRSAYDQHILVQCQYVVAADGAGSRTRHALGIAADGPGDQGHFLNTFFRADYGSRLMTRPAILNNVLTEELFVSYVAVNGSDLWLMHLFLDEGQTPADWPQEKLLGTIIHASGLPDVPVEILSVSPWVMSPKVARQFRKGRVLLTGDAAARLSPTGGLGMNTGLQSAHNLAWKIAAVLHGAPEVLLDSYQAERHPMAAQTFQTADSFRSEVWELVGAGLSGEWDKVRALLATSKRRGGTDKQDLGWRYEQGAFLSEPEASGVDSGGAPGARAPHVWLERDGVRCSTLDLFGRSFVLLAASPASAWQFALEKEIGGFAIEVFQIGGDDGFSDASGRFRSLYGIEPGGAILVRPDGVVAWRSKSAPAHPEQAFDEAVAGLLSA